MEQDDCSDRAKASQGRPDAYEDAVSDCSLTISRTRNSAAFTLQEASTPDGSTPWTAVQAPVVTNGAFQTVTLPLGQMEFFRLEH